MSGRAFVCLILLAVTLSSCSTPMSATPPEASSTGQPTMLPHTLTAPVVPEPVVHLAWFFKPPRQIPIEALPAAFDVFILTHKDEAARDRLRANGRGGPILQYLMLAEIMDPGDCTSDPYGNQVAYRAGDFCEISAQHPDWFLLDQAGKRVRGGSGKYYMDPGNPEFRSFWLERAKKLQAEFGWDGLFIDNVEASRTKFTSRGISLRAYPDEFSFQAAVEGFLAYIEHGYSKPSGKPMLANIVSVADDATWFRYLGHLDGAMMESFATDQSDGRLGSAEWEEQMKLVERALAEGKKLILVSQGRQTDNDLQRYAFASFLLIANGNASFRYANADSYVEPWVYPDYGIRLGGALGPRYRAGEAWQRDFANGQVLVNPKTGRAAIMVHP